MLQELKIQPAKAKTPVSKTRALEVDPTLGLFSCRKPRPRKTVLIQRTLYILQIQEV